jgi:hypothetical protein
MKPLNRPMFRYGGPIKEGVMSGIREPKKNGGLSKQFNTGLVGDERYPKTDGREHHVGFLAPLAFNALRFAARPFGQFVAKQVAKRGVTAGSGANTIRSGLGTSRVLKPGESLTTTKQVFNPNALGSYFARSPEGRLLAGSTGFAGKAGKKIFQGGKYLASSPLTVGGGLIYAGGKFFKDGKEVPPPPNAAELLQGRVGTSGAPGGGDPGMYLKPQTKKGGGVELSAEERRAKNVERYRDIMDIKGMNKDAAYNSLIAASQAINESGDFKGDIKSGKLINQIIQATSKQFDKPKATKDAIDTLILKGEIEKDLKASDPAAKLAAELTGKRIALADKQLAGDTLQDTVNAIYAKTGAFPSGSGLAGVARTKGIDVKMVIKSEDINNFIEQNPGKDAVDFMESEVVEATKKGTPVEPGAYVVKDRIIVIDSEGNVSPYL